MSRLRPCTCADKLWERKTAKRAAVTHLALARSQITGTGISGLIYEQSLLFVFFYAKNFANLSEAYLQFYAALLNAENIWE